MLKEEVLRSQHSRYLHRLHCVLLVGEGHSCYDLARWFDESPRTVERWVNKFNKSGVEGLKEQPKHGRSSKLAGGQLDALQRDIGKHPNTFGYDQTLWNGKLLAFHLEECYEVSLSIRQCLRILKRLQECQRIVK